VLLAGRQDFLRREVVRIVLGCLLMWVVREHMTMWWLVDFHCCCSRIVMSCIHDVLLVVVALMLPGDPMLELLRLLARSVLSSAVAGIENALRPPAIRCAVDVYAGVMVMLSSPIGRVGAYCGSRLPCVAIRLASPIAVALTVMLRL
jgi:hypothetical protein